jgi:anti-sigma regulatory factor (Ser/Thr protein kinase)
MSSDRGFSQTYPAIASSVPRARAALAMFASGSGATREHVEAVRLAVSEALTNAVLHAYDGDAGGALHVRASRAGDELWVRIGDDGCGTRVATESPGLGMGLALIACVTDYFAISKREEGGTEIRLHFRTGGRERPRAPLVRILAA